MVIMQLPDDTPAYGLAKALATLGLCIRAQDRDGAFLVDHMRPLAQPAGDNSGYPTITRIREACVQGTTA